jgi:hypothetical protein
MSRWLPPALLLLAACGSDLPARYVIEKDLEGLRYRRYQKTVGVEFVIPENPAEGHTAAYLRRSGPQVAVATAFVTVYARAGSLAGEVRDRVRDLVRYQVTVEELAGGYAFVLDGGPDERWAVWVSDRYVVKLGAPEGETFPPALLEEYMDLYPSDLDAQGRARDDAPSRGRSQREIAHEKQLEQERERELPRHLGEQAPK